MQLTGASCEWFCSITWLIDINDKHKLLSSEWFEQSIKQIGTAIVEVNLINLLVSF